MGLQTTRAGNENDDLPAKRLLFKVFKKHAQMLAKFSIYRAEGGRRIAAVGEGSAAHQKSSRAPLFVDRLCVILQRSEESGSF